MMQKMLDPELYRHCAGVAEEAANLARRYGADENQAYIAGMVHDYAKRYSFSEQRKKARQLGLKPDFFGGAEKKLLHAPLGALLIKEELSITDEEVIGAVACHTTGRPGMNLLEKIIYLADLTEPGRSYPGVEAIRKAAQTSLEEALLLAVENVIKSVLKRRLYLHPCSVALRNELIDKLSTK